MFEKLGRIAPRERISMGILSADRRLAQLRHNRRHSGARPQALNPESRDCLASILRNLEIPGSIVSTQRFALRRDDCPGMTARSVGARPHGTPRSFPGTLPVTLPCEPPRSAGKDGRSGCLTAAFVLG